MKNSNCKNCKKDFIVEQEDLNFYERIGVPAPTWCPECRQQRRYAWRNERTLYRRNCDLCGKSTITIYSPNKNLKVYCVKCWWSDNWDPFSYGVNFDFLRPFFEQFKELQLQVPRIALFNTNNTNSEHSNHSGDNRNTYLSSCCYYNEDILYSNWIMKSRNCIDCSYIYESGEMLYECVDSRKSYKCQFGFLLENCLNNFYCFDCHNCQNCFLSSNQRNKNYIYKNKQYTREEYLVKIKEYDLGSHKNRENLYMQFLELMRSNSIHRYVVSERNTNCAGSMIFNSKNSKICFDVDSIEDSKYIYSAISLKSSMDLYHIGWGTELAYEIHGGKGHYNEQFCNHGEMNSNTMYSDSCQNSQNIFGCISVKKGEYVILNKKYKKEEYKILKEKIIEHMKKTGEYGEFFPPNISPVGYNETQGNYCMPLTREEVLARGWQWEEKVPGIFDKENIDEKEIPDNIEEVDESIFSKILKCNECTKNYNIVPNEFSFYKNEKIPLPRKCPECRYKRRFSIRLPRKLWHRGCMNVGCKNEFETSYSPERPEIVYCEQCYNNKVY
ncbi:MAG: hypothetical protein WCI93_03245 [bacterium]